MLTNKKCCLLVKKWPLCCTKVTLPNISLTGLIENKLGNKKQNGLSAAKMFTEAVVVSKEYRH